MSDDKEDTLRELQRAVYILRHLQLSDPERTIQAHAMARQLESWIQEAEASGGAG